MSKVLLGRKVVWFCSVSVLAVAVRPAAAAVVATYNFEETSGTTVVDGAPAGGLNNGTLLNGAARTTTGPLAGLSSLSLAAATDNDYVSLASSGSPLSLLQGATSVTVSARINASAATTTSGVQDVLWVGRDGVAAAPSSVRFSFGLSNDTLRIGGRTVGEGFTSFASPTGTILPNTTYDVIGNLNLATKVATLTITPVSTGVPTTYTSAALALTNTFFPVAESTPYAGIGARPDAGGSVGVSLPPDEEFGGLIDNVTLDVVPEPGTMGIAGVAVAGLLARRRRTARTGV